MTETNLTQRNNADWHDSTAVLLRAATQKALQARFDGDPEANKFEQQAFELSCKLLAGEALMPRF